MKKTLLTLSVALVAGAGMATTPRVFAGEGTPDFGQQVPTESTPLMEMAKKAGLSQSRLTKAPARVSAADPIIYEAPAGETIDYVRNSYGFYVYWLSIMFGKNEGASNIVFGNDGYAYIYNPFGGWATNSYLKCEVRGDKLVASLPQAIYEEDYDVWDEETGDFIPTHFDYYATLLYKVEDEGGQITYVIPDTDEIQTISWTIEGDNITMDMDYDTTPDDGGYLRYPEVMFGMVNADDTWTIAGDCMQEYNKADLTPIVPPAGLETSEWALIYDSTGQYINLGFDGDDVYMNNLDASLPDAYVKGKVEGDKIVFESNQYVGLHSTYYIYFMGGTYDGTTYYLTDNITFDYDADKKIMTAPEGTCMMLNTSTNKVYYLDMFNMPVIKVRNPNPNLTPNYPIPGAYSEFFENYGYTFISFSLPILNAEEDILDSNNMYYEVYIDGELFTFYTDEYNIEKDMEQIPYNFTDNKGIYASGLSRFIYFYFTGYETVGLQLFNVVNGKTYASPLTVWSVLENQYYVDDTVGVKAVSSNKAVADVEYYNLQGMKLDRPAPGINVCRTTMEDGSVKVTKVLIK